MSSWLKLIGLKIIACKKYEKNKYADSPKFIFFNDGKTFIELDDQDYYTYHDCSSSAKEIKIFQDEQTYNNLINSKKLIDFE